ncbi:hypothetical protein [Aquipseudomonas guryensis]|jgi:hypothetical protein|uniref:Uncharacterized protein n=1 Tax=Aquipseudomonas guryensis TaxID=2759165 RepID=A0A7W4H3H7_9GAMM|nr:hypothetical protein [Pseudomonas guryensis]MBB1519474.1 hypothetical protein [Pseudomonas guryensis]
MSPQDKELQDKDLQQEQQLLQHYRQHSQGEPSAAVDALILAAARQAIAPATPSAAQRLHGWLFGRGSRTRWSVAFAGLATLGISLSLTWRTQEQAPTAYDMPAPVAAEAPAAPMLREMAPQVAREVHQPYAEVEKKKAEAASKKAEAADSVAGAVAPNVAYRAAPSVTAVQPQAAPAKPALAPPTEALSDAAAAEDLAVPAAPLTEAEARARAAAKAKAMAVVQAKARAQEAQARAQTLPTGQASMLAEEGPALEPRLRDVLRLRTEGLQDEADKLLQALRAEYPQLDLDAELKRLQGETEKPASSR